MKRLIAVSLAAVGLLIGTAAPAFAHDCANLSRPQGNATAFQAKGRWLYIPEAESEVPGGIWVFDNPAGFGGKSGHESVLLDGTGACSASRLNGQTGGELDFDALKGIWSQDCVLQAAGL